MGLKWSLGQLIILVPLLHVKLYLYCGCGHPKKKFNPSGEEFLRLFGHLLLFFQMFHNVSPLIGRTNYSKVIFFYLVLFYLLFVRYKLLFLFEFGIPLEYFRSIMPKNVQLLFFASR